MASLGLAAMAWKDWREWREKREEEKLRAIRRRVGVGEGIGIEFEGRFEIGEDEDVGVKEGGKGVWRRSQGETSGGRDKWDSTRS